MGFCHDFGYFFVFEFICTRKLFDESCPDPYPDELQPGQHQQRGHQLLQDPDLSLPPYCDFTYYLLRDPVTLCLTAYVSRAEPSSPIRNLISFVLNAKWTSSSPNFYLM